MQKKLTLAITALGLVLALLISTSVAYAQPARSHVPNKGLTALSGGPPMETTNFHSKGRTASAWFSSTEGNIETYVYMYASESITHTPPSPIDSSQQVYMDIGQYDVTTGQAVMMTYGWAVPESLQFGNQLSVASLVASMSVIPYYYTGDDSNPWVEGAPMTLSINMAWTALTDPEQSISTSHYRTADYIINQHYNGTHRYAQATGSVLAGTTNFTSSTALGADLVLNRSGYVQVVFK